MSFSGVVALMVRDATGVLPRNSCRRSAHLENGREDGTMARLKILRILVTSLLKESNIPFRDILNGNCAWGNPKVKLSSIGTNSQGKIWRTVQRFLAAQDVHQGRSQGWVWV